MSILQYNANVDKAKQFCERNGYAFIEMLNGTNFVYVNKNGTYILDVARC